jgi:flagellar basal-body rod modification protein FlgD
MSISALSSVVDQSQSVSQTSKTDTLTQQDFLNLLVAQMKNQDPLNPIDNNQMATQMAQFASLDALNNMNTTLTNIANSQASMNSLQGIGLLGKKVEANGNSLSVEKGNVSEAYYQLSSPGKVTIQIFDAQGRLVRTIEDGLKDISKQKVVWDGKNEQGVTQPDGTYQFQVSAVDTKGQSVSASSNFVATVTGISFENGIVYLQCGPKKITLSDIISIQA